MLQNSHLLRPGCSLVRVSPHSRSAIHLKASLCLFIEMTICPSSLLLPPFPAFVLRPQSSAVVAAPPRWPHSRSHTPPTMMSSTTPAARVHMEAMSNCTGHLLSLQTKHEHISPQSQCHKSAVRAAPPLLSGGCYCCGDRLGTRRWRWLYLRCLLAVARQRLLLCSMLTLSSPAMLRRSLEGAVLCAVLPAKRNPNLIQIMFERSGIEPSPPKAPLLSLGGPMTSLQCGMSYFVWGCFFADLLPAFVRVCGVCV